MNTEATDQPTRGTDTPAGIAWTDEAGQARTYSDWCTAMGEMLMEDMQKSDDPAVRRKTAETALKCFKEGKANMLAALRARDRKNGHVYAD